MAGRTKLIYLGAALMAGLAIAYLARGGGGKPAVSAAVKVTVPQLSPQATAGMALFNRNCAVCHGANAAGTDKGPPLIHRIYEPNHHGDISFQRAAKFGVRAHHWPFGNMPPVAGIRRDEVAKIVGYVRELQRANGIN